MPELVSHLAYFAGFATDKPLRYKALMDLSLAAMWATLAYWQCGKSWMIYSIALIGCWTRVNKALRNRDDHQ